MKKLITICVGLVLMVIPVKTEPQIPAPAGNPISLTTSTAIRLVPNPSTKAPINCDSIFFQAAPGNAAVVYILNASPAITMAYQGAGTTTVGYLGIQSASTTTGAALTYPSNGSSVTQKGGADMRYWGVIGTTGDSVYVSCALHN